MGWFGAGVVTGHEIHAAAAAVVAAVVTFFVYLVSCVYRPKTWCWVCRPNPSRDPSKSGRNWRDCWWCHGKGYRLRYGKRIYDRWTGRGK